MNEEELRKLMQSGFEKLRPHIEGVTAAMMECYQQGFKDCWKSINRQRILIMKELSIEEKAKRYDEVFNAAKEWYNNPNSSSIGKSYLYAVFPELKESEDERIRKELIAHFKTNSVSESWSGLNVKKVIAWLEKQDSEPKWCHHKVDLSDCSEEYRKAYYDGWNNCNMQHSQCKSELDDVVKCLINGMKFYYEDNKDATWGTDKWSMPVKHIIEVLEKQGEQKHEYEQTVKNLQDNSFRRMFEQKPVDKVEPKFHEGDWIVQGCNILKIRCVGDEYYCFETVGGYVDDMLVSEIDSLYHLWTIKDAKDGDVLATKDTVFIFKYMDKTGLSLCKSYCEVIGNSKLGFGFNFSINGVYPATKEQYSTLMKAIADAGYTFDFEKKELKKIEQKPDSKGMDLAEEEMTPFQKKVWCIVDTAIEEEHGLSNICNELLALAENELEQKPAWSEEDLMRIDNIIAIIEGKGYPDYVRWLESLKDRVQPQPQQQWSEEDETRLTNIIIMLKEGASLHFNKNDITKAVDWLKSLRYWLQWKPSVFHLECITDAISMCKERGITVIGLKEILDDLKKLK